MGKNRYCLLPVNGNNNVEKQGMRFLVQIAGQDLESER